MLVFVAGLSVGVTAVGVIIGLIAIWRDVQYRKDTRQLTKIIQDF